MKAFTLLFFFMSVAQASSAEVFYRCEFTTLSKKDSTSQIGMFYLSNARHSKVHMPTFKTELDLIVGQNEKLSGTVNGQPGFILTGNRTFGKFESAYATGEINCSAGETEKSMLLRQRKVLVKLSDRTQTDTLSSASDASQYCYFGDAKHMIETIRNRVPSITAIHSDPKTLDLTLITPERKCLESSGTSHEDYECHRYDQPRDVAYKLSNCSSDDKSDNR